MASEDKQAHLETLLTQSENEVNLLQFAMKKVKKEYDQNLSDLTKKLRDYESRELEFAEFKRSSSQRNQEMELLKTKNDKLEAKIKQILTSEAEKISQTLSRNQVLEKENLELHTVKGNLEEKIREISSQISHYKNLNEAHEKYQVLTKKNISKLEEQLEKSNNELNELRKRHTNEISLKSEEINLLRLKMEEYANNNKLLKQHLEQQKQDLLREHHEVPSVSEDRSKLRPVEEIRVVQEPVSTNQTELAERNNELRNLVNQYKAENAKITKKLEEAEHTITELRRNIDAVSLRELESRKMQYELENEEGARKDSSDSFKVPLLHKDRIIELSRKCIEYEQRYFKAIEDNKRLESDLNRIKYEKNLQASEVVKGQQDEAKDNFSLLISKLQQAINKNKSMNDENGQLRKDLEQKDKEIKQGNEEIERYMSKIRTLTVENSNIKARLRALDPTYTSQPLSKEEIDTIKDEELKVLRERNQSLSNELQSISKTTVNSQALNQLQNDYEIVKKELHARNEMIDSLSRQIQVLREANALTQMVSAVEASGHGVGKSGGMQVEQDEEFAKQVNDLVQKRFEFEEAKQKLEQENNGLQTEKKNFLKRVMQLENKVKALEKQNKEYVNQVGLLEKEKKLKTETIANREKQLNDLRAEQNRLLEERNELVAKVGELEEIREKYVEKIRFYEDYTNQVNQINSDVIGDKELYLKMILNQKNDTATLEKHYQAELEKVRKEREEFREQFVKLNNERANVMKQHHEATLGSRLKLENQSIIIANSMKKVSQLEEVITELERQLNDYMVTNAKDFSQELPKLSDLSEILDKSRLTIEDYKNFEAVRELISQQKSKYEDSNKFLENTIETLSQKYFSLEETYLNEKRGLEEQIDKLKQESLDIINRYENRLREQEELARAREIKLKSKKSIQIPAETEKEAATGGMEVEAQAAEEGELPEDLLEREDMENDMENLRRDLNNEKSRREKLERELNAEREKIHKNEEEKTRLRRGETELESEKASLSRKFTLKEVSWIEQKKQYIRQIEEFREEEREKSKKIAELTDKVEVYESQLKKEDIANVEAKQKELSGKVQKLEQENADLKKTLKEKEQEQGMEEEEEGEGEGEEEAEDNSEELNKLKQENEELKMKVAVLEDVGRVKEEAGLTETGVSEDQNDVLQELRKAIDSGSLIDVLERARSLLVTMSQNKMSE